MTKYVWIVQTKIDDEWEDYSMPFMAYELAVTWWGWTDGAEYDRRIIKIPLNRRTQKVSRTKNAK